MHKKITETKAFISCMQNYTNTQKVGKIISPSPVVNEVFLSPFRSMSPNMTATPNTTAYKHTKACNAKNVRKYL